MALLDYIVLKASGRVNPAAHVPSSNTISTTALIKTPTCTLDTTAVTDIVNGPFCSDLCCVDV